MKNYNIRQDLMGDIIAGLTVGIMHIPQGKLLYLFAYKMWVKPSTTISDCKLVLCDSAIRWVFP